MYQQIMEYYKNQPPIAFVIRGWLLNMIFINSGYREKSFRDLIYY